MVDFGWWWVCSSGSGGNFNLEGWVVGRGGGGGGLCRDVSFVFICLLFFLYIGQVFFLKKKLI